MSYRGPRGARKPGTLHWGQSHHNWLIHIAYSSTGDDELNLRHPNLDRVLFWSRLNLVWSWIDCENWVVIWMIYQISPPKLSAGTNPGDCSLKENPWYIVGKWNYFTVKIPYFTTCKFCNSNTWTTGCSIVPSLLMLWVNNKATTRSSWSRIL